MAFTGVTNPNGPLPQPIAHSLTTLIGRNQTLGKDYTYLDQEVWGGWGGRILLTVKLLYECTAFAKVTWASQWRNGQLVLFCFLQFRPFAILCRKQHFWNEARPIPGKLFDNQFIPWVQFKHEHCLRSHLSFFLFFCSFELIRCPFCMSLYLSNLCL